MKELDRNKFISIELILYNNLLVTFTAVFLHHRGPGSVRRDVPINRPVDIQESPVFTFWLLLIMFRILLCLIIVCSEALLLCNFGS